MNRRLLREMHQIVTGSLFGPEDRPAFDLPPAAPPRVDPAWAESLDLASRALEHAAQGLVTLDVEMAAGAGARIAEAPEDNPAGAALRTKYARLEKKAHRTKKLLAEMQALVRGMEADLGELIQTELGGVVLPGGPR